MSTRGFSLIEVLVSTFILMLLIFFLMSTIPNAFLSERRMELRDFGYQLSLTESEKLVAAASSVTLGAGPVSHITGPSSCVYTVTSNVIAVANYSSTELEELTVQVDWDFQGQRFIVKNTRLISHLGAN